MDLQHKLGIMATAALDQTINDCLGHDVDIIDPVEIERILQVCLLNRVNKYKTTSILDQPYPIDLTDRVMRGIEYCKYWQELLVDFGVTDDMGDNSLFSYAWYFDYMQYLSDPDRYQPVKSLDDIPPRLGRQYGREFETMIATVYGPENLEGTIII